MKTMFRAEIRYYVLGDGYPNADAWQSVTDYTVNEIAMEALKSVTKNLTDAADLRIVARTIDEEVFTITDKIVYKWDWWKENGERENAKEMMEVCAKEIIEAEAIKAKTEKGKARKAKQIAKAKALYEEYKKIAEG